MISITTKSPYAIKALAELGRVGGDTPVPLGELARRRDIPVQFLEQLFAVLRRAGVLKSQRGVKGGYTFGREPSSITVLE
ncbi:MAG TPA: Rrf2 family transcriptional regulator, partial [Solirubrobacteraceae bacterium]|nr:Rrf2 family transcriptional regulator [Solirubrobacteraceae bacterium]